jgi:hypothetical protein
MPLLIHRGDGLWVPTSYEELAEAVAEGRVREDHHHDLKREPSSKASANEELAADVASFAVDGGMLYLGLAEDRATRTITMSPVELRGLPERIDQVCRDRISPPISPEVRVLTSPDDPSRGAVVILVPPTPDAPHQVGRIYRGRSDTTNIALSDAEVRRILDERRAALADLASQLDAWAGRDPFPPDVRETGHLFLTLTPVFAARDAMEPVVGREWRRGVVELIGSVARADWSPSLRDATDVEGSAEGWLASSFAHRSARRGGEEAGREERAIAVELTDAGGIRIMAARAVAYRRPGVRTVLEVVANGIVEDGFGLAESIGARLGYLGPWDVAVRITGMRGARSLALDDGWAGSEDGYEGDEFEERRRFTHAEIRDPHACATRLMHRLNRALSNHSPRAWPPAR